MIRLSLLLVLALLGACSSLRDPNLPPVPVESIGTGSTQPTGGGPPLPPPDQTELRREPLPEPIPSTPPVETAPPATPASTLLTSVDQAIAAGELDRAAALCERALRISPRDGHLWYKLATIRYMQDRLADAQGFARRALSFAGPDAQLARDSNALLARINAELPR
jgi:tetratricopeptide (TPR) repeat protein